MSQPRTLVILKPGTLLTEAQRVDLLAKAIKARFNAEFATVPKEDGERMARSLAQDLVRRSNECGMAHLSKELGRHVELFSPSAEECESLNEALGEIIQIRYSKGPSLESRAYRAVKTTSGRIWLGFRRALGLPDMPPYEQTESVGAPRG